MDKPILVPRMRRHQTRIPTPILAAVIHTVIHASVHDGSPNSGGQKKSPIYGGTRPVGAAGFEPATKRL
jgi:hypothetical protein